MTCSKALRRELASPRRISYGRCSGYLNNRYFDRAVGVFQSVGSLVATTGQPYLCANGNPTERSCDALYEIAVALDYPDDLLKELHAA